MTKKELKNQYKELKFPMGVFQIKNQVNGKILVDSSLNMPAKWKRHLAELKFGSHRNKVLQQEWKQYGETAFVYEVVAQLDYKSATEDYGKEVAFLAELYIEELMPFGEKGYNKVKKNKAKTIR